MSGTIGCFLFHFSTFRVIIFDGSETKIGWMLFERKEGWPCLKSGVLQ